MAKRRRDPAREPVRPTAASASPAPAAPGRAAALVLACTVFLAPAVGVPSEELLQDTLKSMVVSFGALLAALLLLLERRKGVHELRWHVVLWIPVLLTGCALASTVWSHAYLGSVEAIRWFIFGVLAWVALNALTRERLPVLALGFHAGAVIASLWAVLQFLVAFSFFPQGPNPASTFVNRNFFAEYVVCTLPFSAFLLLRARQSSVVALLSASTGLVVVAILMTGTRGALIAMWLQLLALLPFIALRYRKQLAASEWSRGTSILAAAAFLGVVLAVGHMTTGNQKIVEEGRGVTAIERGLNRTQSIRADDSSLGVRMVMWRATLRMIRDRPLSGVGAGAWESEVPLYQAEGAQLETDYYVHNEYLQHVAEYGLLGWLTLVGLLGYLLLAALQTWRLKGEHGQEAVTRALLLCSLLALLIVSAIGFPWRLAATGALFALALGGLAASDARLAWTSLSPVRRVAWTSARTRAAVLMTAGGLGLASFISLRAVQSESLIVRAARLALTITASGEPNHPRWEDSKRQALALAQEGIRINPHYRKITPIVADEFAKWGHWREAVQVWETVLSSRPNIVVILANVARGYANTGDLAKARAYLDRARAIRPDAPTVRSLEVALLSRSGDVAGALKVARESLASGHYDQELLLAAFSLGVRARDFELAERAMITRVREAPQAAPLGLLQLGLVYDREAQDPSRALEFFRRAVQSAPEAQRAAVRLQVPEAYRNRLD